MVFVVVYGVVIGVMQMGQQIDLIKWLELEGFYDFDRYGG